MLLPHTAGGIHNCMKEGGGLGFRDYLEITLVNILEHLAAKEPDISLVGWW